MDCKFVVGQRVVCINDDGDWGSAARPEKSRIYTIREIFTWVGRVGLRFEEIVNPVAAIWNIEFGYDHVYFRPVKETNIDVFTAMLNKTPSPTKELEQVR